MRTSTILLLKYLYLFYEFQNIKPKSFIVQSQTSGVDFLNNAAMESEPKGDKIENAKSLNSLQFQFKRENNIEIKSIVSMILNVGEMITYIKTRF